MPIAERKIDIPVALPGENPASDPRASIGHNQPPPEVLIPIEFKEALLAQRPDFLQRMTDAIAAVGRVDIQDDETLGKAGDLKRILVASEGHVDKTHDYVKRPHLDICKLIDAEKGKLIDKIGPALDTLNGLMDAFAAQRLADVIAEEAKAKEARKVEVKEARAAGVPAPPPVVRTRSRHPVKVRSDAGSTVVAATVWQSRVEDYAEAFTAVSTDPRVREAIDAAIARQVKAGTRTIAGVEIWEAAQANTR